MTHKHVYHTKSLVNPMATELSGPFAETKPRFVESVATEVELVVGK